VDRRGHYFRDGGLCVWCKVSPERVADRRAPPFCTEHPDADCIDEAVFNAITSPAGY
jgi:hypothetical protein